MGCVDPQYQWTFDFCPFPLSGPFLLLVYTPRAEFLSCIAFGVNEVVHVACQLRSWFAYETEKPRERLCKR